MAELSFARGILLAAFLLLTYCVALVAYRLLFHPLAKFPGPKFTAATFWYQFYYDVIKRGKFMFEIISMHEKYGLFPSSFLHSACGLVLF